MTNLAFKIPHSDRIKSGILEILSSGQFFSGDELGRKFNISRMAISKHVTQLRDLGVDIFSVKGKGYALSSPMTLLARDKVIGFERTLNEFPLYVYPIVGSTNDLLKGSIAALSNGTTIVAECQTKGKGRQGRHWISPYGTSLAVSTYWGFSAGYQSISGLSLAVGLAVIRTLQAYKIDGLGVKWPNDIYVNRKKIAGVLIELEGQFDSDCHCIIGMGLNVNLPSNTSGITQAWTDIYGVVNDQIDRNELLSHYLINLMTILSQFNETGLVKLVSEWNQFNIYQDKDVTLQLGQSVAQGICRGIDANGALLVEIDNQIKPFHGGEIRIAHE